ncbi:hypothetical protein [Chitinimonas koreensis]|uniref:hypothetical protein n=1 Tax=Chitinimonas koreensis TaxID=356302 RepID=UPI00041F8D8C|nr:hypothetical protein [Chitinimonas koreensis]
MLTLVIPGARFVRQFGFDPLSDLRLPALASLLGRAERAAQPGRPAERWLRERFGAAEVSAAALTLAVDAPDAPAGHWLRADPVHLRPDRDRALLFDASAFDLDAGEAAQLVAGLNALYAADGLHFLAATPTRWYLRLAEPAAIATTPLAEAAGHDIRPCLPAGPDALRWHRLLNEIQMYLYSHPVNDAREARGLLPVNSVWPWGEGAAPSGLARPWPRLWADAPLARGLACAAGVEMAALPAGFDAGRADGLVWLDTLERFVRNGDLNGWRAEFERLEAAWFVPLLAAWRGGALPACELLLPGEGQTLAARLEPAARWKFWRRPAEPSRLLAEPAPAVPA